MSDDVKLFLDKLDPTVRTLFADLLFSEKARGRFVAPDVDPIPGDDR